MTLNNLIESVNKLQTVVLDGFEQKAYYDETTGVFRSHYDWHSSVHGHWMLLSSARIFNNKELVEKIVSRLTPAALRIERTRLLNQPLFELPYGQAWLLLLIYELEKNIKLADEIICFRKETALRVLQWLEKTEFPEKSDDAYHSWIFSYLMIKKSKNFDYPDLLKTIDMKFYSVDSVNDANDPKDFFSSENLFRIVKNSPSTNNQIEFKISSLSPVTAKNAHAVGKLISQAWQIANTNNNYLAFVDAFLKETRLWKDDYLTVSHWTPQFLWFGIWLHLGEP